MDVDAPILAFQISEFDSMVCIHGLMKNDTYFILVLVLNIIEILKSVR